MGTKRFTTWIVVVPLLFATSRATVADWPQYRGPNQDGISTEQCNVWPAAGPKLLWKVPNLSGWSSFAVSGGKAFTLVGRDVDKELCIALVGYFNSKTRQIRYISSACVCEHGTESQEQDAWRQIFLILHWDHQ